jgi:hypothetical protein
LNMVKEYDKIGEVRETHSLRVAGRGNGLYLFLPRGLCEVHRIIAGDRIKVQLRDHFRLKNPDAEESSSHSSSELSKGEIRR